MWLIFLTAFQMYTLFLRLPKLVFCLTSFVFLRLLLHILLSQSYFISLTSAYYKRHVCNTLSNPVLWSSPLISMCLSIVSLLLILLLKKESIGQIWRISDILFNSVSGLVFFFFYHTAATTGVVGRRRSAERKIFYRNLSLQHTISCIEMLKCKPFEQLLLCPLKIELPFLVILSTDLLSYLFPNWIA